MQTDNLPMIIKLMREGLGLNQDYLAKQIGVDNSSLSKYESGSPQIARASFLKVANLLYLNSAYIENGKGYPFKSDGRLIRLLIKGFVLSDPTIFFVLIYYARHLEFVSLIPSFGSSDKVKRGHSVKGYPYAIAARDQNNYFLLRMRFANIPVVKEYKGSLSSAMQFFVSQFKKEKNVTFRDVYIGEPFYESLRRWDILTVDDVKPFFSGDYDLKINHVVTSLLKNEIPENLIDEVFRRYRDRLKK